MNAKIAVFLLMVILMQVTPIMALSEQEEFELYKQFKESQKKIPAKNPIKKSEPETAENPSVININNNNNPTISTVGKTISNKSFLIYEKTKKSKLTTGLLSLFVPSMGHLYAGKWLRGSFFLMVRLAALTYMFQEPDQHDSEWDYDYYRGWYLSETKSYYSQEKIDEMQIAAWVYTFATVFEMYDAVQSTNKYNEELLRHLDLGIQLRNNQPVIAMTYQF